MATFVLVHGAFHGAWCWFKLVPELERRGHAAIALDLPGAGADPKPVEAVTPDDYVERIVDVVLAQSEPVYLVAHSLGGVSATAAAERIPQCLRRLIYLSALIPRNGDTFTDIRTYPGYPENPGPPHFEYSDDRRYLTVLPDLARPRWYNDCAENDIAYALSRCTPLPTAVLNAPVRVTSENFGSVPKSYIHASLDHAVVPALQETMAEVAGCQPNYTLPTGHSSFLAAPEKLADILSQCVAEPAG